MHRVISFLKKNKLLYDISHVFSGDLFAKILVFVTTFLLASFLSVSEFGKYNFFFSLLSLSTILVDPFLNTYLRDFRFYNKKKFDFGIILIPFLLTPLFVLTVTYIIKDGLNVYAILFFSLNYILFSSIKTYLNVFEKYRQFSLSNITQNAGILLSSITLLFFFEINKVELLIQFNYLISLFLIGILYLVFLNRDTIEFSLDLSRKLQLVCDSKYLVLYLSIIPLMNFVDLYFVKKYLLGKELGYYSFSLKLFSISLVGLGPLLTVFRIQQIDNVKGGLASEIFNKNFKKISFSVILFLLVLISGFSLFTLVFFPSYSPSLKSSIILFCCSAVSYISIPFSYLIALRKYRSVFILAGVALIINTVINYYFVPIYGISAAATSTLLSHSFLNIGNLILSFYFLKIKKN